MARGREFVWKESDGNVPIADWLANEIRLYAKRKFGVDVAVTIRPQPPSSAAGLHEAIGLHKAEKSPASGKSGSGKSKGERP